MSSVPDPADRSPLPPMTAAEHEALLRLDGARICLTEVLDGRWELERTTIMAIADLVKAAGRWAA